MMTTSKRQRATNLAGVLPSREAGRPWGTARDHRTARFWMYLNTGLVRIKISKGQELTWCEGSQTDDGYSYTGHCWVFDGEEVGYTQCTNARDCDGPISYGSAAYAKVDELTAIAGDDCKESFPHWQTRDQWQRDHNAEAAGY